VFVCVVLRICLCWFRVFVGSMMLLGIVVGERKWFCDVGDDLV
jgi:hypothetical protein